MVAELGDEMKYKLTKKIWQEAGKKAGWIKEAQYSDSGLPNDNSISPKEDLERKIQNDLYMSILHDISEGKMKHNALLELEEKLAILSGWIVDNLGR